MPHEPGHVESFAEILASLTPEQLALLGGNISKGFPSKPEAIEEGIKAGIQNPGGVTFNNEWFYTDPDAPAPKGTWANEGEAREFAQSINRADLVPVFDSKTGRFRLEEPPQSTPTGTRWIPEIGKYEVTLSDGRIQLVDPAQASGATQASPFGSMAIPGTDFVLVNDGQGGTNIVAKSQTEDTAQGEVVTLDGRQFIRQPNGTLQPLGAEQAPSLDQMISKALLAGDIDGAIALSDFRDRPSSMELFQAALDFAQSPGDTAAISAIARGQTLVEPGPPGSVQRIAAQPEFLQNQFQKLMGRFRDGGGTPNDIVSALQDASNRMREDQDARVDAEQSLADRDATDAEKQLQDLLDRLDALENPPKPDLGRVLTQAEVDALPGGKFDTGTLPPVRPGPDPFNLDEPGRGFEDAITALFDFEQDPLPRPGAPVPVLPGPDPFNLDEPGPPPVADVPATISFSSQGLIEDDLFAHGGVFDDNTAIVGEEGPELLIARPGSRVIPLDKGAVSKLKKRLGVKGLAHGGEIAHAGQSVNELIFAAAIAATPEEDRPFDPFNVFIPPELRVGETLPQPVPINAAQEVASGSLGAGVTVSPAEPIDITEDVFGVQQVLRGGSLEPTRRRLSTASGLPVLSAQSRQRLLPSERDVIDELRAQAGITRADFAQEQRSAVPGARVSRASRFAARVAR